MNAPIDLIVNDWDGFAQWSAPDSTNVIGYNVYLDSVFVAFTEELSYQFENLIFGNEYIAGVSAQYSDGESEIISAAFTYNCVIADDIISLEAELVGSYPNPFNPSTTITFSLSLPEYVSISIYNTAGQLVKKLVDSEFSIGNHNIVWNGVDNNNKRASSGMYLLRMQTKDYTAIKKIMMIK